MSGTSLDGIDVAVVDIVGQAISPVAFRTFPYTAEVRAALLQVNDAAAISRMNFLLGELYAEAIRETCRLARVPIESIELCGLHGQTIFHEGTPVEFLGRRIASTLQIGEAAIVAERIGLRVISNFRERDIAAGGQGAPLVPYVDYLLFRNPRITRVAINVGGIANITVLPARARRQDVLAFDTGPGNMVIDALITRMTDGKETFDRDGRIARSATVNMELLQTLRRDPYFDLAPPKSAGREQFGEIFVNRLVATGVPLPDLIATATELTANSIATAILHSTSEDHLEAIVSGGGVHNTFLMQRLRYYMRPWKVASSARFGIAPDAKEAIAFAVLAYASVRSRSANLPSATGARHAAVLGKITLQ